MRRFLTRIEYSAPDEILLNDEFLHHARNVLRMEPGQELLLLDGQGEVFHCRILSLERSDARARVLKRWQEEGSSLRVRLLQGIPKGDKIDLVLQKGTELGVDCFSPVMTQRCIVRLSADRADSKRQRWEKIALEAARQSQGARAPQVDLPQNLDKILPSCSEELRLVFWEGDCPSLSSVLPEVAPASVALLVGPEGGLSRQEVDLACSCGFVPVSLGRRILRSETAGLAAVTILQYLYGDLG